MGSKKRALENMGVSRTQLDMGFSHGYVKLGTLLQVLDEIGVPPDEFFWRVFDFESRLRTQSPPGSGEREPSEEEELFLRLMNWKAQELKG